MQLSLTFTNNEHADAFKSMTGESDLNNVHIGLINLALSSPGIQECVTTGEPMDFIVQQADGSWTIETIADPVARIKKGAILEPVNKRIKMLGLASESWNYGEGTWGQIRIQNAYLPVTWPVEESSFQAQRDVIVFVMDSGINTEHDEFVDATIENFWKCVSHTDYADDLRHGTGIASLIVGKTLGLARNLIIKNVKISSGQYRATLGELGAAFDSILEFHQNNLTIPKIVNCSWGIPKSLYIESKIQQLRQAGVLVVAAAGNTAMDIDIVTPAGSQSSFSVAASDKNDEEYVAIYGTNKKIDMYAPGVAIDVAAHNFSSGFVNQTGSSYSAAFVSAVAGKLFSLGIDPPSSENVVQELIRASTKYAITANDNVKSDECKVLRDLGTKTSNINRDYYLGAHTINELYPTLTPSHLITGVSLAPYIGDFPSIIKPVYTIDVKTPQANDIIDLYILPNTDKLEGRLKENVTKLPDNINLLLVAFTITAEIPGLIKNSQNFYFFIKNESVAQSQIDEELTKLNDPVVLAFFPFVNSK